MEKLANIDAAAQHNLDVMKVLNGIEHSITKIATKGIVITIAGLPHHTSEMCGVQNVIAAAIRGLADATREGQ